MFAYTDAIKKLRKLKKRIRGVPGGTSAGKTFGIIPLEIDYAIKNPLTETSIVSESIPHLRRGALKDFEKIMRSTNRWIEGSFNKSLLKYTFANGSFIEFFSADQPDKLRGARRHRLYMNECNNMSFDTYKQLSVRTRDVVWLDFNPTNEFWYHTELKDDEDLEELVLTYKDNNALSESIVKEIEKALFGGFYDPYKEDLFHESNIKNKSKANWWKVYGLGLVGSLEGVVFQNWVIIPNMPKEAKYVGTGLDFGYTNDPTAIVDVYQYNGQRILDEVCYKHKMVNNDIANVLQGKGTIWADSAEPKSIEEIYRHNVDIRPVKKGADSINFGIQVMQNEKYLVTSRSTNLIKELRSYCYDVDKTGAFLNKPIDDWNHAIDAVRYHEMMTIGLKKTTFVF